MAISIEIGPEIILSYKRLSYTPWNAIAEFVDNSTQTFYNNISLLEPLFLAAGTNLQVSIVYAEDYLSISDNSIGMDAEDLENALKIGVPTSQSVGRSKYGMGLKTAACWIGNRWRIKTKRLGTAVEYTVELNVEEIAAGNFELPFTADDTHSPDEHYTHIEIFQHNRKFVGRSISQIKQALGSIYREDFRRGILELTWNKDKLGWVELDNRLLVDREGRKYRDEFKFEINGIEVSGWVGVLREGSRRDAGFTVLQAGRVIQGYPEAWRPELLYGPQGSNDLANQRLVGEIHVDGFDVSHTKDSLLWVGELEEAIERKLAEVCWNYREVALSYRKRSDDQRGPTAAQTELAINAMSKELQSDALVDAVTQGIPLPEEVIIEQTERIVKSVKERPTTFEIQVGDYKVRVYIEERSPYEPYLVIDSAVREEVGIIINIGHPHWLQQKDTTGVINYFRHCIYDGIAEWQALHQKQSMRPGTIKMYKDKLLWIPVQLENQEMEEFAGTDRINNEENVD